MVGTVQDITEQAQIGEQLRRAQRMEAIGTLASGMAHDFNNILQPILLFSDLLRSEVPAASEGAKYIEHITRSATRAGDLIAKILLYSRQGELGKTPCDIGAVTEEVMGLILSTLPKSITLELACSEGLPPVLCDPSQYHQVLLNLCINGAHAIAGQGELTIELSKVELEGVPCVSGKNLDGKYVRIAVTDTGAGMDEETVKKIFDPFFTTKGLGEGTGLGLSMTQRIAREHGGRIEVDTRANQGTTFSLLLPLGDREVPPTG